MEFQGKIALVTGGAGGIGRATVGKLAELGATVISGDLAPAEPETAGPGRVVAMRLDVTSSASVSEVVGTVEREIGPIEILVNNAGWDKIGWFVESDEETWDRVLAINLKGQLLCTHAVLQHMVARKSGRIVCVASDAGRVGSSGEVVYSAAKGGVIAFSKACAREVARHGITVNCVAPGPTDTPFLKAYGPGTEKIIEGMKKATPLRRLAEPREIAEAIAFLASAQRAGFITGQTLSISGGLTMA